MKIITVNINKGGTGKTTISYNLAKFLTEKKDKKVLLIDGDRSCNLSYSFDDLGNSTIADIFTDTDNEVEIYSTSESLDVIQGSEMLEDDRLDLQSKYNNSMLFFVWIADNYEMLEKYDYIVIDTHNDSSLVTSNFLAVADIVLGVSEPSRNGLRAWFELGNTIDKLKTGLVDLRTRESYVDATPYLIANRVSHIGNTSKDFLEEVGKIKNYLGMVQKKELLAKSLLEDQSIFEQKDNMSNSQKDRHKEFYDSVEELFVKIMEKADNN